MTKLCHIFAKFALISRLQLGDGQSAGDRRPEEDGLCAMEPIQRTDKKIQWTPFKF